MVVWKNRATSFPLTAVAKTINARLMIVSTMFQKLKCWSYASLRAGERIYVPWAGDKAEVVAPGCYSMNVFKFVFTVSKNIHWLHAKSFCAIRFQSPSLQSEKKAVPRKCEILKLGNTVQCTMDNLHVHFIYVGVSSWSPFIFRLLKSSENFTWFYNHARWLKTFF